MVIPDLGVDTFLPRGAAQGVRGEGALDTVREIRGRLPGVGVGLGHLRPSQVFVGILPILDVVGGGGQVLGSFLSQAVCYVVARDACV